MRRSRKQPKVLIFQTRKLPVWWTGEIRLAAPPKPDPVPQPDNDPEPEPEAEQMSALEGEEDEENKEKSIEEVE